MPQWLQDLLSFLEQTKPENIEFQNLPESFKEEYASGDEEKEVELAAALLGATAKVYDFEPYEDDYIKAVPEIVVCLGIESAAETIDLPVRRIEGKTPLADSLTKWVASQTT